MTHTDQSHDLLEVSQDTLWDANSSMPMMHIAASIDDPAWANHRDGIKTAISTILSEFAKRQQIFLPEEINDMRRVDGWDVDISFSNDAIVQRLNAAYRDKDKPTNVLSFPNENAYTNDNESAPQHDLKQLGNIILAYETCDTEAKDQQKSFLNHVTHLILHGLLHIIGYDHIDPVEAEDMEALEIDILAALGIENPYTENLLES